MALWLLKSREIHKIPLSVMDGIAKDMQSIIEMVVENFKYNIHAILHNVANLSEAKDHMSTYTSNFNFNLLQGLHSHSTQLPCKN